MPEPVTNDRAWAFYVDDMIAFAEKASAYSRGLSQQEFVFLATSLISALPTASRRLAPDCDLRPRSPFGWYLGRFNAMRAETIVQAIAAMAKGDLTREYSQARKGFAEMARGIRPGCPRSRSTAARACSGSRTRSSRSRPR